MERRPSRGNLVGRQVGRYAVVGHLASGGMSELYVARQEAVGGFEKNLVVKVLQDRYAQHPRVVRMFLDEARLAAKLNHPSIVNVYDVDEADGNKFIAMEYIHGETLTDIIKRGVEVGSFLPLEHALYIVSQVAAGLDYAHRRHEPTGGLLRIVHRDVSPSNIMVSYEGQTKVIDFGIARVQDQIREESGMHPGKPSYMSPEQVAGVAVDYRSDIFSLGIILFEITLAQRLWRGPAEDVKRRILSDPIPPPTSIRRDYPPALELIVMRALEKRPEDRYQSAEEMRQDLEELVTAAGFRSGARRMAMYMGELFPLRSEQAEDGTVQPLSPHSDESAPLPVVGAAPHATEHGRPARVSASMATISSDAVTPLPVAEPITPPPRRSFAPSSPSILSSVSDLGAPPRSPEPPAPAPAPHGPSNAKLALGAAIVTFALVTAVVLLGRSRRPDSVSVPPPGGTVAEPSRAPVHVEPMAPTVREPERAPERVPERTIASVKPSEPPPAEPDPSRPAPPPEPSHAAPSRGSNVSNDRSRYRRPRRQQSVAESSTRSSSSSPSEVPSAAPSSSPPSEVQRPSPPVEPVSARPPARIPAVSAPPPAVGPAPVVAAPTRPPGWVDPKAVTAVVRQHAAEVQGCFDRALMEHNDLRGRLTVRATLDPSGHVLTAAPTAVMEGGGRLQTCVVAAFQHWTFPQPTGGVKGTITYSFSFE